jgi:hypothetical protein
MLMGVVDVKEQSQGKFQYTSFGGCLITVLTSPTILFKVNIDNPFHLHLQAQGEPAE